MAPIVGVRYKCTVCPNFDLCETCESQGLHPHPHPLLKVKHPIDLPSVPLPSPDQPTGEPRMVFIGHETLPEDTQVKAGSEIVKIWKVSNPGPDAWPAAVRLVMMKGNLISQIKRVEPVEPGKEGLIHAYMIVPESAGAIKGTFRLVAGRKLFGEELRVKLQTIEPEIVDQIVPGIKAMGFKDEGSIRNLLKQYYSDANAVVTTLFPIY